MSQQELSLASEPVSNTADGPLVDYRLIKMHLTAAGVALLISMIAGFLYSLQFLGYFPFPSSEALSPGHMRLFHTI